MFGEHGVGCQLTSSHSIRIVLRGSGRLKGLTEPKAITALFSVMGEFLFLSPLAFKEVFTLPSVAPTPVGLAHISFLLKNRPLYMNYRLACQRARREGEMGKPVTSRGACVVRSSDH